MAARLTRGAGGRLIACFAGSIFHDGWKAATMREKVSGARRWVVKIGSALLTADGRGLDQAAMAV